MYDIHNHLLYGLDDGPRDLETAVAMARMAAANGATHMACTPHASSAFAFRPDEIATRLATLRAAIAEANIALTLGQGCDFHISYDNIQDALANPRKYTINGGEYLLIELPDQLLPPSLDQTIYDLRVAGMTPILTHPERNPALQRDSERLKALVASGMWIQVTANSVTGGMGKTAQRLAHEMLEKRWVHILASDAHDLERRPPDLSRARAWVEHNVSARYAEMLTVINPQAVFDSKPMPEQMPMLGFDDVFVIEEELDATPYQRPWWKKFLGMS